MYIISSLLRLSVNVQMKVHVVPKIQYSNYAISKTIVNHQLLIGNYQQLAKYRIHSRYSAHVTADTCEELGCFLRC